VHQKGNVMTREQIAILDRYGNAAAPTVRFQRLPNGDGLPVPKYESELAAGMDLPSAEDYTIMEGAIATISCGFNVAISEGYEGSVRPRSGLARKHGISIVNSPGTIDADYRGEICCILINHGTQPFVIHRGDRIAQMVVAPVARAEISEVKSLDETERGASGFGSTGTN
jgi:dUTP pyrophosphatase